VLPRRQAQRIRRPLRRRDPQKGGRNILNHAAGIVYSKRI
jgi:hypothetical protein